MYLYLARKKVLFGNTMRTQELQWALLQSRYIDMITSVALESGNLLTPIYCDLFLPKLIQYSECTAIDTGDV